MNFKLFHIFRWIGIAEGVSFLLLLLIAMPMKYFMNWPQAVTYTGWAHGLLFISYIALAYYLTETLKFPYRRLAFAVLAALIPLGTFFYDKQLKRDEAAMNHKALQNI